MKYFPKRTSGAPLHTVSKLYDVPVGFVPPPPPFFWGSVLLYLRSPKGGFCSISDDLSCSCLLSTLTFAISFEHWEMATVLTVSTFFSTELLVFLLCRQTDKEFRLPWPSFVRVEIYYKYRLSIIENIDFPNRESSIAEWLERWPLDPGVMSSSLGLYLFSLSRIFFISLFFLFFLNFEVKQCGSLYWKYDNTGFAMEKKPSFFIFSKLLIPHVTARLDT